MLDPDHPGSSSQIKTAGLHRFLRRAQREIGLAGQVNVRITSSREMRRLNREFRGKDKPTDVLSFPADQNGKVKLAGDIAISFEIAQENAKALGHPVQTELKILLLHGLLHLAGYDHDADQGEMTEGDLTGPSGQYDERNGNNGINDDERSRLALAVRRDQREAYGQRCDQRP